MSSENSRLLNHYQLTCQPGELKTQSFQISKDKGFPDAWELKTGRFEDPSAEKQGSVPA
jgi:hypothetical protein